MAGTPSACQGGGCRLGRAVRPHPVNLVEPFCSRAISFSNFLIEDEEDELAMSAR
jgi:hypothetical protein